MDSFESLVAMLLRQQGYWTWKNFKVGLTKPEKRKMGVACSPRWEIDVVAYKGSTNEVLAVECKSFLYSRGVLYRNDSFERAAHYKLFMDAKRRRVVLNRLKKQLVECGACRRSPHVKLCLAAGHIASQTDGKALRTLFKRNGWTLFDEDWVRLEVSKLSKLRYENDVAVIVSKILENNGKARDRSGHFMEVIGDDSVEILNAVPPGWEDDPDPDDDDDEVRQEV